MITPLGNWDRTLAGSRFACYPIGVFLVRLTTSGSLLGLLKQHGDNPDRSTSQMSAPLPRFRNFAGIIDRPKHKKE